MKNIYEIEVRTIVGKTVSLGDYAGKVLLIVNTASRCGLAPQYAGLEKLHREYRDAGLVVLGFPSNQFLHQEPGTESEIGDFCRLTYDVSFPLFAKIAVNGPERHPLYEILTRAAPGFFGRRIKWNFTKFLVDKSGRVVKRYAPSTRPEKIARDIARLLTP